MNMERTVENLLREEASAILSLIGRIDSTLDAASELIYSTKGRVIFIGLGKSGIVARKISATLSSTGTSSFFIHAAEAAHGDLGMVTENDTVVFVSKSGKTKEILRLIEPLKRLGVKIISITSDAESELAQMSDVHIDTGVKKEACPFGIIPTTSSVATLAVGDALTVSLILKKGITPERLALTHPAGNIGKMLTRVGELMHKGEDIPIVPKDAPLSEAIMEMTTKKLGHTLLVDKDEKLFGIFSDGDLRRTIQSHIGEAKFLMKPISLFATLSPKSISGDVLAYEAVRIMEENKITGLPIVDKQNRVKGFVHLHDLLRAKVV